MRTVHAFARLGIPDDLLGRLSAAAEVVGTKLRAADLQALEVSDYTRTYLRDHLAILPYSLQSTVAILGWALDGVESGRPGVCLVDYGGGVGLLSLVAKAAGVVPVVYADLRAESVGDAQRLARQLGLEADRYLTGDLPQVVAQVSELGLRPWAFASYDVIEHIYDVPGYIAGLVQAGFAPLRVVYASSANASNPRIRRHLSRIHVQVETEGLDGQAGFLARRRGIIGRIAPEMAVDAAERLAQCTRGLAGVELEAAIRQAVRDGTMPIPSHPTNTCEPNTGNWCEQLLAPGALRDWFAAAGFTCAIRPGYYGESGGLPTRVAKWLLNALISVSGSRGLALSPYYVVVAELAPPTSEPMVERP